MAEGIIATRLEINDNLPAAVSYLNLTNEVVGGTAQVKVEWGNPTQYFGGVAIVRKEGSAPTGFTDGVIVYDGTGNSCTDPDVEEGKTYYYRAYTYNARRQIQTIPVIKNIVYQHSISPSSIPYRGKVYIQESGGTIIYYKLSGNDFLRNQASFEIGGTSVNSTNEAYKRFNSAIEKYNVYAKYTKGLFPVACMKSSPEHLNQYYDSLTTAERITTVDSTNRVYGGSKGSGSHSYYFLDNSDVDPSIHNDIYYDNGSGEMKKGDYATSNREFRPYISLQNYSLYAQPDRDGIYSVIL